MMLHTTWHELIRQEMARTGDSPGNIVSSTLSPTGEKMGFDSGYGLPEGTPFTLWTRTRVYFPVTHDGAEWVGSVSRNPDSVSTPHIGGY